jgi:hypothetical protein
MLQHADDTCCGIQFGSQEARAGHLLKHNILATTMGGKAYIKVEITKAQLGTAQFCADTYSFYPDPRDWAQHCEHVY